MNEDNCIASPPPRLPDTAAVCACSQLRETKETGKSISHHSPNTELALPLPGETSGDPCAPLTV
ncbi:UNVERIFIED_CONTAM: hypothetical protein FKN15_038694 [Acipenser sinensis]